MTPKNRRQSHFHGQFAEADRALSPSQGPEKVISVAEEVGSIVCQGQRSDQLTTLTEYSVTGEVIIYTGLGLVVGLQLGYLRHGLIAAV